MNNWKKYLLLASFVGSFPILLLIYPTDQKAFNISVIVIFTFLTIISLIQSWILMKELDNYPMTIKKGKHHIQERRPRRTDGRVMFKFKFTPEHQYLHKIFTDQTNKLLGLSTLKIHQDSIRIGWKQSEKNWEYFKLYLYVYSDGKRTIQYLANIKIDQEFQVLIDTTTFKNLFIRIGNVSQMYNFQTECKWLVFPYFGGTDPAPDKMQFDIKFKDPLS